jgi:biotin operon repressor
MPGMVSKSVGTGVYLGARYSMEDVVNFGGIPAKAAEVRSSERIRLQPNADAPQMERAQTLTQAKKAGSISGTSSHSRFSLASLSNDTFVSRAAKLGVSLGESSSKVSNMIQSIKDNDNKRTIIMLSKNLKEKPEDKDQQQSSVINQATELSHDLVDEEGQVQEEMDEFPRASKITKVYTRKKKL